MDQYNAAISSGEVPIFSQYSINEMPGSGTHTGMRDEFQFAGGNPSWYGANRALISASSGGNWGTL